MNEFGKCIEYNLNKVYNGKNNLNNVLKVSKYASTIEKINRMKKS